MCVLSAGTLRAINTTCGARRHRFNAASISLIAASLPFSFASFAYCARFVPENLLRSGRYRPCKAREASTFAVTVNRRFRRFAAGAAERDGCTPGRCRAPRVAGLPVASFSSRAACSRAKRSSISRISRPRSSMYPVISRGLMRRSASNRSITYFAWPGRMLNVVRATNTPFNRATIVAPHVAHLRRSTNWPAYG